MHLAILFIIDFFMIHLYVRSDTLEENKLHGLHTHSYRAIRLPRFSLGVLCPLHTNY